MNLKGTSMQNPQLPKKSVLSLQWAGYMFIMDWGPTLNDMKFHQNNSSLCHYKGWWAHAKGPAEKSQHVTDLVYLAKGREVRTWRRCRGRQTEAEPWGQRGGGIQNRKDRKRSRPWIWISEKYTQRGQGASKLNNTLFKCQATCTWQAAGEQIMI